MKTRNLGTSRPSVLVEPCAPRPTPMDSPRNCVYRLLGLTLAAWMAMSLIVQSSAAAGPGHSHRAVRWIGTWTSAAMPPGSAGNSSSQFTDQTIRQIVRVSAGGKALRLRFSNQYGSLPLTLNAVTIATHDQGAAIVEGSVHYVTFGGYADVTIPPGGSVVSDIVSFPVSSGAQLAVSIYARETHELATYFANASQTAYVSTSGDHSDATSFPVGETTHSRYWLTMIEVEAPRRMPVVVTFGDSIMAYSEVDQNERWPDYLAARANTHPRKPRLAVANQGIGCNRLLSDYCGPSGLTRFERDVLGVPGVTDVVIGLGLVDLAFPTAANLPDQVVSAEQVIFWLQQLAERALAHGLRVYGATLTPSEGSTYDNFYTPENEQKRQLINAWIRTSPLFHGVLDVDAVVRDPAQPTRLRPEYAAEDRTHINGLGARAIADAVDLRWFR